MFMQILKQGKLERRFKCPRCKCKFKASFEEYSIKHVFTVYRYQCDYIVSVHCPYCNYEIEK